MVRITFDWPVDINEVYIFTVRKANVAVDNGRLFTLQEYIKQGGYFTKKQQGLTKYYILTNNEFAGYDGIEPSASFVGIASIVCRISERNVWATKYKNYEITLISDYNIPKKAICYVKSSKLPMNITDGVLFKLNWPIKPDKSITCVVQTLKHEYIKIFVNSNEVEGAEYGIIQT